MRHARKRRRQWVDGDTWPVRRDLNIGLIRAVAVTPAHASAALATDAIVADLQAQAVQLVERHLDRG